MDRTRPTLNQLNIVSVNVEASIAFYCKLGVAFAQIWDRGWSGRKDLAGRVVAGFGVSSREEVDRLMSPIWARHRAPPPQV